MKPPPPVHLLLYLGEAEAVAEARAVREKLDPAAQLAFAEAIPALRALAVDPSKLMRE